MIVKGNLKNLDKVGISVWGCNGKKFINGNISKTVRVYDATPDEVMKIIEKALSEQ